MARSILSYCATVREDLSLIAYVFDNAQAAARRRRGAFASSPPLNLQLPAFRWQVGRLLFDPCAELDAEGRVWITREHFSLGIEAKVPDVRVIASRRRV